MPGAQAYLVLFLELFEGMDLAVCARRQEDDPQMIPVGINCA